MNENKKGFDNMVWPQNKFFLKLQAERLTTISLKLDIFSMLLIFLHIFIVKNGIVKFISGH